MRLAYIVLLFLIFISGVFYIGFFHQKRLDEKVISKGEITLRFYRISGFSNAHDFIDLERNGYCENIYKANSSGVYNISIHGDTIIIQTYKALIYNLVSKTLNTEVILDSTITTYQYMKKFQPENAKYYQQVNNQH